MIKRLYKQLYNAFGPQHWWPAETSFEVVVGAILTQNTSWKNVEKAIECLKERKLLDVDAMYKTKLKIIKECVKPAGFYNQKAERLKLFVEHVVKNYDGNLNEMLEKDVEELRKELLSLKGIGKETADSILLYAANKPVFVIDAYTKRICKRMGISQSDDYEELRALFEKNLNPEQYNEMHALLVELAKRYCKKKPLCDICVVSKLCKKQVI